MTDDYIYVYHDYLVTVPAAAAWQVVGDFGARQLGKGFVRHVTVSGEGVGATRTLTINPEFGGGEVCERQAARHDAGYYYAYELLNSGPLPMTDYLGSVHVIPVSTTECRITWTNRYRPLAVTQSEQLRAQSLAILELIEHNTREILEH